MTSYKGKRVVIYTVVSLLFFFVSSTINHCHSGDYILYVGFKVLKAKTMNIILF
jgi:hypothetical protein